MPTTRGAPSPPHEGYEGGQRGDERGQPAERAGGPELVDGDDLELDLLALLQDARALALQLVDGLLRHLGAVQEKAKKLVAAARGREDALVGVAEGHLREIHEVLGAYCNTRLLFKLLGRYTGEVAAVVEHASRQLGEAELANRESGLDGEDCVLLTVLFTDNENHHSDGTTAHEDDIWKFHSGLIGDVALKFNETNPASEHIDRLDSYAFQNEFLVQIVGPICKRFHFL